ncbi:phage tail tape measure protein [Pseudomonas agarici]|uniref:phage tail tape measure protein n=1 Tax=Pseudomonas agarici TaxID=46677 RepID=UPI001C432F14|nr:phage tail tape measure protein [Pseudomonas agarici]
MANDLRLRVLLDTIDRVTAPLRNIQRQSTVAAQALKAARDRLKGLNESQKQINGFRELKQGLSSTRTELQAAHQRTQALGRALSQTQNPTRAMTREFEQAKRAMQQLKQQETAQTQQLQQMRQRLNAAGISTRSLGEHERRLRQDIINANQQMERQRRRLEELTRQQQRLTRASQAHQRQQQAVGKLAGTGAAAAAGGGAALYAGARLLKPGVEYGAQMGELQAVTRLEKDDERFKGLKQQARDLGASTAFSATQVGAGQTFLARAGFTPQAINASMQDVLDLALANGVDLARAADIASNISSAFKIDPEIDGNITRVTDVLSAASSRANVNLEMLGDTMKYMGSAEDLGLTLEQAASMAGLLGNIGIQGSQAGTTMRAMLNRLTAPTKQARKSIAELGLEVSDSNGNLRAMPDILQDVANATAKMGNIERAKHLKLIFGEEAGSGMAELVNKQGTGALTALLGDLKNAQGENSKMARIRADNIDGDLKGLRSAWEEVGISITDVNDGPIRDVVNSITDVVRNVGQWIKANPKLSAGLSKTAAIVASLMVAMGGLMITVGGILLPFIALRLMFAQLGIRLPSLIAMIWNLGKNVLPFVGKAVLWLGRALMLNPIGLALTTIAGAAYLIYKNWDAVKAYFSSAWGEIKAGFSGGVKGILTVLANFSPLGLIYQAFAGVLSYLGVDMPSRFTEFGGMIIDGLINGLSNGLGMLKDTMGGISDSTIGWFKEKLGIQSPSRVFAELGGFTMAGLTRGLEGGQTGPLRAITSLSKQLTAAGTLALGATAMPALAFDDRPPISSTAANVVDSHDTYQFTLAAAPGMDLQSLEKSLRAMLTKIENEKKARQRSQLSDRD